MNAPTLAQLREQRSARAKLNEGAMAADGEAVWLDWVSSDGKEKGKGLRG